MLHKIMPVNDIPLKLMLQVVLCQAMRQLSNLTCCPKHHDVIPNRVNGRSLLKNLSLIEEKF